MPPLFFPPCRFSDLKIVDYGSAKSRPAGHVERETWFDVLGYPEQDEPFPSNESLFNHHWHWVCLDLDVHPCDHINDEFMNDPVI